MNIRLRNVRLRLGVTLLALSELSGVSISYISEIERGIKCPTIDILCKIAAALGVKTEELYTCDNVEK